MNESEFPVIVCSGTPQPRCVVYGYVDAAPEPGVPVVLRRARMVLQFGGCGVFGLAASGPVDGTRMTAAVAEVTDGLVQQWLRVSPEAAVALDGWAK